MQWHDDGQWRALLFANDHQVAEYVYAAGEAPSESPRPYLNLRTLDGREMTGFRPDDHPWHRGLSLALPHVGDHNFWGGPTFDKAHGYVQRENNGAQLHSSWATAPGSGEGRLDEVLDWVTQGGERVLCEERRLQATPVDERTWALSWTSEVRNVSDAVLRFGSPATKGRAGAGYAGVLWRGRVADSGGSVLGANGAEVVEGSAPRAPWMAYVTPDRVGGVLMHADADTEWFTRATEYAGMGPAPFAHHEAEVEPGAVHRFAVVALIGDGDVVDRLPRAAELARALSTRSEEPAA